MIPLATAVAPDSGIAAAISRWAVLHPKRVIAIWAVLALASLIGVVAVDIDTSTDSFVRRAGSAWQQYAKSVALFGNDEFVTVEVPLDDGLDFAALRVAADLTGELERVSGVRRVDSIATVPLIRADSEGWLRTDSGLADGISEGEAGAAALRALLVRDLIAPRLLLSEGGGALAFNIHFEDAEIDARPDELVSEVVRVAEGFGGLASGVPVFRAGVNSQLRRELAVFVPWTLVACSLILLLVLRDPWGVPIGLSAGGLGALISVGCMGLGGVPLTLSTMILPCVLLALGCAYSMHPIAAASVAKDPAALGLAVGGVARAVGWSGITTAAGFASMGAVRLAMIRDLAIFGSIGVLAVTAAALSFTPALLALRGPVSRSAPLLEWSSETAASWCARIVVKYRALVIGAFVFLAVVFSGGISMIRNSTNVVEWFSPGMQIRDDYEQIRADLAGITPVNVLISAEGGARVTAPAVLGAIARLKVYVESMPEVGKAVAATDPLRQINSVLAGQDGVPETEDLAEQYLVLLDGSEQVEDLISSDRTAANVAMRMDSNESVDIVRLGKLVDEWWAEYGEAGFSASFTGIMYQVARSADEITLGLLKGLSLAVGAIGVVLLVLLRSVRSAMVALVPNLIPLVIGFGAMGFLGVPLDAATVVLGSMALGIAVDDTIHVALAFGLQRGRGHTPADALRSALPPVVPALIASTAVICGGFAVLAASSFTLIGNLGVLTSGIVILCLICDLLLLPALLTRWPGSVVSRP